MTVDEFLDHWLKTAVKPKVRQKTYSDYAAMLRRYIRPANGKKNLASLSPLEIQAAYQVMIDRKLSARTVRYAHAVLRAAIAQRCAALHVPNPCSDRDALIAATALVHGMTVVTRNVTDFQSMSVAMVNPWLP